MFYLHFSVITNTSFPPQCAPTRSVFYAMEHYWVISYSIKKRLLTLWEDERYPCYHFFSSLLHSRNLIRYFLIPCRCNRRTCHCLSCPQQCLSKAIFHLLHTYPSHHTGFLCNAVCTCTLFFHEFSYVKILSYFKGFVKGDGRKTRQVPTAAHTLQAAFFWIDTPNKIWYLKFVHNFAGA